MFKKFFGRTKPGAERKEPQGQTKKIEAAGQDLGGPEERRAHRERVGGEAVREHLQGTVYEKMTLEQIVSDIFGAPDQHDIEEQLGISRDKSGRYRLKKPGAENIPGSYINEEHLKAFVVGMASAKDIGERLKSVSRVFEYMGLPFKDEYTQIAPEEQKAKTLPLSTIARKFRWLEAVPLAFALFATPIKHEVRAEKTAAYGEAEAKAEEAGEAAEAETEMKEKSDIYALKKGDRVWNVVERVLSEKLGSKASKKDIEAAARAVCEANGIKDQGLGVSKGLIDSRFMRPGMMLDLSSARQLAESLSSIR